MASVGSATSGAPLTAADLAPKKAATSAPGTMGQTDFMSLLMAQMKNQNPLDPQSSSEFASQLAQFSSLQGINKMNDNLASLLTLQGLNQGTNLIGKTVTYTADTAGHTASGVVQSVQVTSGEVQIVVGGKNVPIGSLTKVAGSSKA